MNYQRSTFQEFSLNKLNRRIIDKEREGWEVTGPFRKAYHETLDTTVYLIEMKRPFNGPVRDKGWK